MSTPTGKVSHTICECDLLDVYHSSPSRGHLFCFIKLAYLVQLEDGGLLSKLPKYHIYSVIRWEFTPPKLPRYVNQSCISAMPWCFHFRNNPKDLDPSCKTDLDL